MFSTLTSSVWGLVGIGLLAIAIPILVGVLMAMWTRRVEHRRNYHRPIILVCEVSGRVGIVLRRDSDEASHQYWKQYYDGKDYNAGHVSAPNGCRLVIKPLFNFKARSLEYYTICYGCYVEKATFYVPAVYDNMPSQIAEAYQYFHGKPWNNRLIHW